MVGGSFVGRWGRGRWWSWGGDAGGRGAGTLVVVGRGRWWSWGRGVAGTDAGRGECWGSSEGFGLSPGFRVLILCLTGY
ncbi:MAG: hypothetical protein K0U36_00825 [Alphaproteobacteria bacterium]|nr:hypothetical protein [Alphaproteobacteria bacterium]